MQLRADVRVDGRGQAGVEAVGHAVEAEGLDVLKFRRGVEVFEEREGKRRMRKGAFLSLREGRELAKRKVKKKKVPYPVEVLESRRRGLLGMDGCDCCFQAQPGRVLKVGREDGRGCVKMVERERGGRLREKEEVG